MASLHISATPVLGGERRRAEFPPNIWEDRFLKYTSNIVETEDELNRKKLKEEVRMVLKAAMDEPAPNLELIDAVQRLGVSYHFEREIDELLQKFYAVHVRDNIDTDELHAISLGFRLLRQHGYRISSDIFNEFKDGEGKFKESLTRDARGMLSLYEAAHLRVHGEDILEEALAFTTNHLASMATQLSPPLAAQISHALRQPLRSNLPRLEARRFLSVYGEDPSHCEVLLSFAKLDFNILQKQHQKELSEMQRWRKDLDLAGKFPFARDRSVELYFWVLEIYFEPEYALGRKILFKVISLLSIMDDIYDVYGTIEELDLLTAAIERWDINERNGLSDYMKVYYQALLDSYNEIEDCVAAQGRSYGIPYAKEMMKRQAKAYLGEAKWFNQKYVPTLDEYMSVADRTAGLMVLATTSLLGLGDIATQDTFEWIVSVPKIMRAASIIGRILDDIVSHKFEQKRGHVASSIECYQKQHGGTVEEAVDVLRKQMSNSWKDINEECLNPTTVPMPILVAILNLTRSMEIIYKDGDSYTFSGLLKPHITELLVDPVPM